MFARVKTSLKAGVLSRPATKIRGAVVHTTESGPGTLWGIVAYFKRKGTQADSHYVVGDVPRKDGFTDVVRVVPEGRKAWTALTANPYFVQYELVARAAYSRAYWLKNRRSQIRTLGALIAEDVLQYGFPVQMRKSPGILGHGDLRRFGFPNPHTDPGTGFPWDVLKQDILYFLAVSKYETQKAKPLWVKPKADEVVVKRSRRRRNAHRNSTIGGWAT